MILSLQILLVTHSNAALNDLFEKILQRDVDPRHLLRLGSGERDLLEEATGGETFSKQGRVEWSLARRAALLAQVSRLAVSLGVPGDVGYTCETAAYFHHQHVLPRIDAFRRVVKTATAATTAAASSSSSATKNKSGAGQTAATSPSVVAESFPFTAYFADAPTPLFTPSPSHSSHSATTTSDGDGTTTSQVAHDLEAAEGGLAHVHRLFEELADYR